MPRAVIFTVPTVGHVNHAIALSQLLRRANFQPSIVTGMSMETYIHSLQLPLPFYTLQSFDLVMSKRLPGRKSHFRQVFAPAHVAATTKEVRRLVDELRPALLISKDYIVPHLIGSEQAIPCAAYLSDGLEQILGGGRLKYEALTAAERSDFALAVRSVGLSAYLERVLDDTAPETLNLGPRIQGNVFSCRQAGQYDAKCHTVSRRFNL